ncbi:hypothetical protein FXO37_23944 [Capsicum annuum]|nr:hypothetical protein FXO37_23944 [Capsicum annuum]
MQLAALSHILSTSPCTPTPPSPPTSPVSPKHLSEEQYAAWKSECQNIVPIIGSGKLITSAIVCNDGQPIASDDGQPIASDDGQPIASDDGQPIASDNGQPAVCATSTSNSQDNDAVPAHNGDLDKKMLQWKLILHQIVTFLRTKVRMPAEATLGESFPSANLIGVTWGIPWIN